MHTNAAGISISTPQYQRRWLVVFGLTFSHFYRFSLIPFAKNATILLITPTEYMAIVFADIISSASSKRKMTMEWNEM